MKKILIKILLATTLLLLGSALALCTDNGTPYVYKYKADSHSSLAEEMLNNMESLIGVLESVTDSSTSKKAMLEIERINKIGEDIQTRMVKLGEPSEDMLRELDEKYRVRGEAATTRLRQVLGGLIESEFGLDIMQALN